MTHTELLLLAISGFAAGLVNGVAGGGSLVSFPALLTAGFPALTANVTSTVGIWPGYLGGAGGFHREIRDQSAHVRQVSGVTIVGSIVGVLLLLTTPSSLFRLLAPYLILAACALFAVQPILSRRVQAHGPPKRAHLLALQLGVFASSVYGSYFGAGLGVLLLGVLGGTLPDRLLHLNGLRSVLSLAINTIAMALFIVVAPVAWAAVVVMAPASLIGGYTGARFARRLPTPVFRVAVIALGVIAATRLLLT